MDDISILWDLIEQGKCGKNVGLSTGLKKLDKIIGGIQPSRYYLLGAGSSVGKSALVIFIMYQLLRYGKDPVTFIYYSLELGAEVILSKLMGLYCAEEFGIHLTTNDIFSFEHPISDSDYEKLAQAKDWLNSVKDNLIIIDKGLSARILYKETLPILEDLGYIDINEEGREFYVQNDPRRKVIGIIDHLSLARAEDGRTKKAEMDLMSSYMVTIKRKFKMSWFALMQHNRESSSMDRRKADLNEPTLSDLKDTGSPSEDADVVIQLFYPYREKLTTYRDYKILSKGGLGDVFRSLIITKNRYGIANKVIGAAFYGSIGWWNELPPGADIENFSDYVDDFENVPCKLKDKEAKDEVKLKLKF